MYLINMFIFINCEIKWQKGLLKLVFNHLAFECSIVVELAQSMICEYTQLFLLINAIGLK